MANVNITEAFEQNGKINCLVEVTEAKGQETTLLARKWLLFDAATADGDVKSAILADPDFAPLLTTKTTRSTLIGPVT